MTDTPKSRRLAGRAMFGAALVALPLTATISYAASDAPLAPVAPLAPLAPVAPLAPTPPVAPEAPLAPDAIIEIDPDSEAGDSETVSEQVFVIRSDEDGEVKERRWVVRNAGPGAMSEEEIEAIMAEVNKGLAEADAQIENLPKIIEETMTHTRIARAEAETARAQARSARAEAMRHRTVVESDCDGDHTSTSVGADGTRVVKICRTEIMAEALEGLRQARAEIAGNRQMDPEIRNRVLRELDQQIDRWKRDAR